MFDGQPAAFAGLNVVGLKRSGFSRENINALKHVTKLFFQDKLPFETIQSSALLEPEWGSDQYAQQFLEFIKQSSRGVSRRCFVARGHEVREESREGGDVA
jgi:UDP-N-acetylglucosamine acyltransferase